MLWKAIIDTDFLTYKSSRQVVTRHLPKIQAWEVLLKLLMTEDKTQQYIWCLYRSLDKFTTTQCFGRP